VLDASGANLLRGTQDARDVSLGEAGGAAAHATPETRTRFPQ